MRSHHNRGVRLACMRPRCARVWVCVGGGWRRPAVPSSSDQCARGSTAPRPDNDGTAGRGEVEVAQQPRREAGLPETSLRTCVCVWVGGGAAGACVCVVWIRRDAVDPPRALVASTHHTHTHTHTPQTLHHPQLKRWPRPRPPSLCQSRATPAVWSSSNQIFKPARRGSTWHGPSTDTRPRRSLPPHHTHTRAAGLAQASLTPRLWCASNTLKRGRTQTFIAPTVPSSSDRRAADPHKRCKQTFAIHPRWPLLPPPPSSDTHTHCPTRSKCRGPLFVGSHGPFVGPFNCFVAASRARGACCGGALPPGHAGGQSGGSSPRGRRGRL